MTVPPLQPLRVLPSPAAVPGAIDLDMLERHLPVRTLRLEVRAGRRLEFGDAFGNALRGAFGISLRKLVCHDLQLDCRTCPLLSRCPYPKLFEPVRPEGVDRLRRNQEVPRPYVVRPPQGTASFAAGEVFALGFVVIGRAILELPYLVTTFLTIFEPARGPARIPAQLLRVTCEETGEVVFERGSPKVHDLRLCPTPPRLPVGVRALGVRFASPVALKQERIIATEPTFGVLVKRARDRINALATFYGAGPLDLDFKGLGTAAERVRTRWSRFEWSSRTRWSSRTDRVYDIAGVLGAAEFEAAEGEVLDPFLPFLHLAERIHVGRACPFGNGRIELYPVEV